MKRKFKNAPVDDRMLLTISAVATLSEGPSEIDSPFIEAVLQRTSRIETQHVYVVRVDNELVALRWGDLWSQAHYAHIPGSWEIEITLTKGLEVLGEIRRTV